MSLSGRITSGPSGILHSEILGPQFNYELENLLPYYLAIEKIFVLEYERLELITGNEKDNIITILDQVTKKNIKADPTYNMSDILFAIERHVEDKLDVEVPAWHIDRSRNDIQACAQVMFGREQLLQTINEMRSLFLVVHRLAENTINIPMPGYTHYQAAQIITPGFYLSAVSEQLILSMNRMLNIYDEINKCPLGAGAMSGGEFEWDRHDMAKLLGFSGPQKHSLNAVASRDWTLKIASELSNFGVFLSRIITDLIQWGSSEYRYIDLPDHLSGISSAMPQKKNFPILERLRGKTAHLHAFYIDFILGQRNTAYTNLVETSKEAGTHVNTMFDTFKSIMRLFTIVISELSFNENRMLEACKIDFFGGFSLANLLTLHNKIPYRQSQIITGQYILKMLEMSRNAEQIEVDILKKIGLEQGYQIKITTEELKNVFDVSNNLKSKITEGSVNPLNVKELLNEHKAHYKNIIYEFDLRKEDIQKTINA
ncbi:argininosuccinate lyase [Sporosarcina limicola]|uniref:argininosuccinate lyase n=1 Tax=Sporosarcina limicola TaxID=34101 RepID=A0A927MPW8_9BACL|nr:argininosuccinate lyase [Sporosarcina limicola]